MLPSLPQCGNRDDNGAQIVGGKEAEVACCIIIIRYGNIFQFIFGESATTYDYLADMIFVTSSTSSASVIFFGSESSLNVEVLQMIL